MKRWELKTGGVLGQAGIVPEFSTRIEESQLAILGEGGMAIQLGAEELRVDANERGF